MKNLLASLLLMLTGYVSMAQVVSISPAFATQNDTVDIIFDATQGNGDLAGANTTVYAHTGVILDGPNSTNWQNVQGNWGTDDNKVKMTFIGNDRYFMRYHIPSFYGLNANDTVYRLSFVFRNQDGSLVGRNADGSDIFVPIFSSGFQVVVSAPTEFGIYNVNDSLDISATTSANADLSLRIGATSLLQSNDTNRIDYKLPLVDFGVGRHDVIFEATVGASVYRDTISYLARFGSNIGVDTLNGEEGLTVLNDSSIYLKLRAPLKDYVYVIGDFNNWDFGSEYEMHKTPDGQFFWAVVDGLDPNAEYGFQYYVGSEGIRIADPYSEMILDPWNDPFIPSSVYPNLKPYPTGKTDFPVGVFKINEDEYQWTNQDFKKPNREELVIYKLLIRDFDDRHSYQSVVDRLPYLDSMGINAIEFMPVMEFEGNESWGYNPMFFMAPDKYYGSKNDFKALVDSCHSYGMAVYLDIALNHAFGQCPLVRLYFDPSAGQYGQPTAQSPWFNQVPKHDFNVGYDFNHESEATKYFARRVFQHWVEEYKIDGYRVDLSKGFTQNNTLGNVGAWGQFDAARIATLTRIKNEVEEVDSSALMILEHFADNSEETELANRGFMLWGNSNHQYNEATMGYPSNLASVHHSSRGWSNPNLIAYMESHDEERLMYKNLNFGNSNSNYDTRLQETALERMELAAAFFFTVPGPKMMWQFGEMGYDFSINYCPNGTIDPDCRVANKPIRWDYLQNSNRAKLVDRYGDFIGLRNAFPGVFQTDQFSSSLNGFVKSLVLENGDSSAVILGNFGIVSNTVNHSFPSSGWWYDFLSGDSINVQGSLDTNYAPGEYHIYTNFKTVNSTNISDTNSVVPIDTTFGNFASLYPNPSNGELNFVVDLPKEDFVFINISTPDGKVIFEKRFFRQPKGYTIIKASDYFESSRLRSGLYYYSINSSTQNQAGSFFILK